LKTIVLGATGHIGATLVRMLIEARRPVRAFVRPTSDRRGLEGLNVEVVHGDVLDPSSLERAFKDCTTVYHLATPNADDPRVLEIATHGTKNVFETMQRCPWIVRAVYTSSTVTVGYTDDPSTPLDESAFNRTNASAYHIAKYEAESWVLRHAAQTGAPVVVVNPCVTIGPNDFRPTEANRFVLDYMRRSLPLYFAGGLTIADVEDVARGHLLAELRGIPGQRYILGGDRVTVREHLTAIARAIGAGAPWLYMPRRVLLAVAAVGALAGKVFQSRFPLRLGVVRAVVGRYASYSSQKAVAELGYTWRSHLEAVQRAVAWLQQAHRSARAHR
jgi:dihydroflavonol-4-reductase